MGNSLTLAQLCQNLLNELLGARTDFLLRQTAFWQEMNASAKNSAIYTKPESLDLTASHIEFCIRPRQSCFLMRLIPARWRPVSGKQQFSLCGKNDESAIRVLININLQDGKSLKADINTEPELNTEPEKVYVTGIT